VWHYSAWLWGYGGDWLKDGKPAVNSPQAIQAMKVYGDTLGKFGPPGPTDLDDGRMVALFQAGKAAHHYSHPTYSKDFQNPEKSQVAGKLGWTMVPAGPAGRFTEAVGVGVSISAKSPNKEPAWFLLQFLTDKPMMEIAHTKVGIFTPRKSAWDSAVFAAEVKRSNMEEWRDVTIKALETGRGDPLPPVVDMAAARDAIGVALTTAIRGGDIKPAADEANSKYERLLASG
jgi:multiple sugar transport system substrate-binding protein